MKYILSFFLLLSLKGLAQGPWKDYIIGAKGDTLNRTDHKGRKQGPWVVKVDNLRGERGYEEEGEFVNGKKEGTWRRFTLEGDLIAVESYRWGNKNGKNVYMTPMGEPLREESWRAVNPDSPYDTVNVYDTNDPTKIVAKQVVKVEGFSLKHGTWRFYDPMRGTVEKTENWYMDKPAKRTGIGDDDLAPIAVTDNEEADAKPAAKKTTTKPKEVLEFEKKNAGKKKVRMRDGGTGG